MQGIIEPGLPDQQHLNSNSTDRLKATYKIYFGLGQNLNFTDTPGVFKVSLAGVKLGHCLIRLFDSSHIKTSLLDIGTGSGVHALLMRRLGYHDITATDISEAAIEQARRHEHLNFRSGKISFIVTDLFTDLPEKKYQTIIFNPPGWRTPSHSLIQRLNAHEHAEHLPVSSMFYGDEVVSRFLDKLPYFLEPNGKAVVGLNSLLGIRDVLEKYSKKHCGRPPLAYRLLERHTLPLLHYSDHWKKISRDLEKEFEQWAHNDLAAYTTDCDGNLYWSYEIIEFFHRTT